MEMGRCVRGSHWRSGARTACAMAHGWMGTRYIGTALAQHATLHIPPCEYWARREAKLALIYVLRTD